MSIKSTLSYIIVLVTIVLICGVMADVTRANESLPPPMIEYPHQAYAPIVANEE